MFKKILVMCLLGSVGFAQAYTGRAAGQVVMNREQQDQSQQQEKAFQKTLEIYEAQKASIKKNDPNVARNLDQLSAEAHWNIERIEKLKTQDPSQASQQSLNVHVRALRDNVNDMKLILAKYIQQGSTSQQKASIVVLEKAFQEIFKTYEAQKTSIAQRDPNAARKLDQLVEEAKWNIKQLDEYNLQTPSMMSQRLINTHFKALHDNARDMKSILATYKVQQGSASSSSAGQPAANKGSKLFCFATCSARACGKNPALAQKCETSCPASAVKNCLMAAQRNKKSIARPTTATAKSATGPLTTWGNQKVFYPLEKPADNPGVSDDKINGGKIYHGPVGVALAPQEESQPDTSVKRVQRFKVEDEITRSRLSQPAAVASQEDAHTQRLERLKARGAVALPGLTQPSIQELDDGWIDPQQLPAEPPMQMPKPSLRDRSSTRYSPMPTSSENRIPQDENDDLMGNIKAPAAPRLKRQGTIFQGLGDSTNRRGALQNNGAAPGS